MGIPQDLIDSAKIDGASELMIFYENHGSPSKASHHRHHDLELPGNVERFS